MVSHFLSAMDRLADPALLQFVKHLQSRAQGEVSSVKRLLRTLACLAATLPHFSPCRALKCARRDTESSLSPALAVFVLDIL